ncbi:MAG: hypothetical protein ACOCWS_06175 [Alkalispirochaetaceae bacterium]
MRGCFSQAGATPFFSTQVTWAGSRRGTPAGAGHAGWGGARRLGRGTPAGARRAYVLETGNITLQDTVKALLTNERVKRAYLGIAQPEA